MGAGRTRMRGRLVAFVVALGLACSMGDAFGQTVHSPTIAMPDGVKLAADVVLPADAGARRFPTVLIMSPYGRATRLSAHAVQALTAARLALVFVDVRGTGASQGQQSSVFSREERGDLNPILDWIAKQPWSDGRVISTGASYDGNLAALALAANNPVLVAAMPRFVDFDTYRDLAVPGGVRNEMFLRGWGRLTDELNHVPPCLLASPACPVAQPNIKPVDGDDDRSRLRLALADHRLDWSPYAATMHYAFEDDRLASGSDLRGGFLSAQGKALTQSTRPVELWGSWFDASTADSALEWWAAAPKTPMVIFLGAWTHGGGARVDPFTASSAQDEPGAPVVAKAFIDFADRALASPQTVQRQIHYYTAGAAVWRTTSQWPPANVAPVRWYFADQGALSRSSPATPTGADRYSVNFATTTGNANRWTTQLGGGPVSYGDRAAQDALMLAYSSAPLAAPIEITGTATVGLHLSASAPDGAIFVYLETVAPDGRVTYLSEGELRLPLRGPVSAHNAPPGVDPSFLRKDFAPLIPCKPVEVGIRLHAVSARIPAGYRLRIAIAGADAETFARYPAAGGQTYTLFRSRTAASYIDLPQAAWRDGTEAGAR
jgi:putative CocE/NonD family hydrolase